MSDSIDDTSSIDTWHGDPDLLDRKQEGQNLLHFLQQRYVNRQSEDGFVLALNGDWGSGKTYFIEKVCLDAIQHKHPTFVFDAWKNDFTTDPLLAFIAEFDSGLSDYFKKISVTEDVKIKVKEVIKKCWKPALTIIGGALLKHGAGMSIDKLTRMPDDEDDNEGGNDELDESSDANKNEYKEAQKKLGEALKKALGDHRTMKESISRFKQKVGLLVDELSTIKEITLPILVFVDELDRCRPDYAVELLEGIKHLFGVAGVYFVVSTNISQLTHSVKAIYGEGFDGQTYLKRFFDLHYSLTKPDTKKFCRALVSKMDLPPLKKIVYGLRGVRNLNGDFVVMHDAIEVFTYILERHSVAFQLKARDQLQVATIIEAALLNLKDERVHVFFLVFLAVVYHFDLGAYSKLLERRDCSTLNEHGHLNSSTSLGTINVLRRGSEGEGRIKLQDVAQVYFRVFNYDQAQWREQANNASGFPNQLTVYDDDLQVIQYAEFSKFASYCDIVRRAGCFSRFIPVK